MGAVYSNSQLQDKQLQRYDAALWLMAHDVVDVTDIDQEPGWCLVANLSDTFGYGCADAEDLGLQDCPHLREIYRQHGHAGVVAWAAVRRCAGDPVEPVATPQYHQALQDLRVRQVKTGYCRRVFSGPQNVPVLQVGQMLRGFVVQDGAWWLGYCLDLDQAVQENSHDAAVANLNEAVDLWVKTFTTEEMSVRAGGVVTGDWWSCCVTRAETSTSTTTPTPEASGSR